MHPTAEVGIRIGYSNQGVGPDDRLGTCACSHTNGQSEKKWVGFPGCDLHGREGAIKNSSICSNAELLANKEMHRSRLAAWQGIFFGLSASRRLLGGFLHGDPPVRIILLAAERTSIDECQTIFQTCGPLSRQFKAGVRKSGRTNFRTQCSTSL